MLREVRTSAALHLFVTNPVSANPVYTGANFVTTVPADGLAPDSARPSAGPALNEELNMFTSKFLWLSIILCLLYSFDDVIQNIWQGLKISPVISTVNGFVSPQW